MTRQGKYRKPQPTEIQTEELCKYNCGQVAQYKFTNGMLCCSKHYNSCPGKKKAFSDLDHTSRTAKSLETRIRTGVTKTTGAKARATNIANGNYARIGNATRERWATPPWANNVQCPVLCYKSIDLVYQGTYEFEFLEELEAEHGLEWIALNVNRGPAIRYIDPTDNTKRLYISDFIIHNTIYEIKSGWTWNKHGKDLVLEEKNKAKLNQCLLDGYEVRLILNKKDCKLWQ